MTTGPATVELTGAAVRAEIGQLAQVLAAAFGHDPIRCHLLPDERTRPERNTTFFTVALDNALTGGGTVRTTPDRSLVAILHDVPAEGHDPGSAERAVCRFLDSTAGEDRTRLASALTLLSVAHPVGVAHSYLEIIGVAPRAQGTGIGSAVLAAWTAELDGQGMPAYLEASSPRSAALYRRWGFTAMSDPIVLPDGPYLIPLWRSPRRP